MSDRNGAVVAKADKKPRWLQQARISAMHEALVDDALAFPAVVTLPGGSYDRPAAPGVHAQRVTEPPVRLQCRTRDQLRRQFETARDKLRADGVVVHIRPNGSVQLLDHNFADPAAQPRRNWLAGIGRNWLGRGA